MVFTLQRQVRGKNDGSAAERLIQSIKQFEKDIRNAEDEKEDEKARLDMIKTPHVVRTSTAGARGVHRLRLHYSLRWTDTTSCDLWR